LNLSRLDFSTMANVSFAGTSSAGLDSPSSAAAFVCLAPFQSPWHVPGMDLPPGAPLSEMRVRMADGRDFRGADAVVFLWRFVWWGNRFPCSLGFRGHRFFSA